MKSFFVFTYWFLCSLSLFAQENESLIANASVKKNGQSWTISFTAKRPTDVEISIINQEGKILRHLAAGKIGTQNTVAPLTKNSLQQEIVWDGSDDQQEMIASTDVHVQIRCGLSLKLEKIIGGDPYAFFTEQLGIGDHAGWALKGMEAKSDGKVYIIANLNTYGIGVVRCYEADGTYHHLVYPPPANHKLEDIKNWGVILKDDQTYSFLYNDLGSPSLGMFPLTGHRAKLAFLMPNPDRHSLSFYDQKGNTTYLIKTDGTNPINTEEPLVKEPPLPLASQQNQKLFGEFFLCPSTDKKSFFLSGVFNAKLRGSVTPTDIITDDFWRDGRIYQVDIATKKAKIFYEIDPITDRNKRFEILGDSTTTSYAAFHGITTDKEGNLFICDRQNKQILILDAQGKQLKTIPLAYPDAITISQKTNKLYVTSRIGSYHNLSIKNNPNFELKLYAFADWRKDTEPFFQKSLGSAGMFPGSSYLTLASKDDQEYLWVAYNYLPVQIYADKGKDLELHVDFNQKAKLHSMDFQYLAIDTQKEQLYVGDGFGKTFRISPTKENQVEALIDNEGQPISSIDIIVDSKYRKIYTRTHHAKELIGYTIHDDGTFTKIKKENQNFLFTDPLSNDWRIHLGFGTRGGAVTNRGDLVTLGSLGKNDYSGSLIFWENKQQQTQPWPKTIFTSLGDKPATGGVQVDLQGNIYVGLKKKINPKVADPAFSQYGSYLNQNATILKFTPTSTSLSSSYYPSAPEQQSKEYTIPYGPFANNFTRTTRFAVDLYGRLYIPDALYPKVRIIDNESELLYEFGTYGNQDSKGGLEGDLVQTKDIPMIWPNSVVVSDQFVYVGDIVNSRLLCLRKKYQTKKIIK